MHFQEFWASCAQNKTSEISKNAFSGNLGLTRRRKSQRNALSRIPRLLCAPQGPPKGAPRPWLQWLVSFRLTESLAHRGSPTHTTPSPRSLTPNPQHLSIQYQSIGPTMANSCPQRAGPGPGPRLGGWGGGPGPALGPWPRPDPLWT